ncbi:hypothetical protein B0O99DRAFT_348440 [Bisporella sp. PMI_857]|nr:hypothetical protein B0O99DRAFT_348440 [Bisporella sp. PMI_857]
MSFLKKPFQKLKEHHRQSSSDVSSSANASKEENLNIAPGKASAAQNGAKSPIGARTPTGDKRQSREILREEKNQEKIRRSLDKERNKVEAMKRAQLARIESKAFQETGPTEMTKLYKPYSMNMSRNWKHEQRVLFKELNFAGGIWKPR